MIFSPSICLCVSTSSICLSVCPSVCLSLSFHHVSADSRGICAFVGLGFRPVFGRVAPGLHHNSLHGNTPCERRNFNARKAR